MTVINVTIFCFLARSPAHRLEWTRAAQDIYVTRFGSTDQAASLEGALKLDASAVVGPERSAPSAIVHGKSSAAGTVKGIGFVDVDVCFWQLARHNLHNADALSARAVPTIGERCSNGI